MLLSENNVTFILGPTNTGKTFFAIEKLISYETGIIGLLILFYYLFNSLFLFYRFKKIMYFLFFVSILGMCLIEDYLNNNAAITFLAFFGNLFLFQTLLLKANKEDELS